jgi:hypothetical protein
MSPGVRELTLIGMVKKIEQELETLKQEALSQDDMLALSCLHTIAHESTRQLFLLAEHCPELVSRVAEHKVVWPVLYAKASLVKETADYLVDELRVGAKRTGPLDPDTLFSRRTDVRRWIAVIAGLMNLIRAEARRLETQRAALKDTDQITATITAVVTGSPGPKATDAHVLDHLTTLAIQPDQRIRLCELLEVDDPFAKRATLENLVCGSIGLPELSAEEGNVKAWMKVFRQFLTDVYEGYPEKSPLRIRGLYVAKGKEATYGEGSLSYESNVRGGMFQALERALRSLAAGSTAT